MAEASKSVGDQQTLRFLEEWLDGSTIQSFAQPKDPKKEAAGSGFVRLLYETVLAFFSRLVSYTPRTKDCAVWTKTLKADVGSLYLWGECYEGGELDQILADSDDLRNIILELLATLGVYLQKGMTRSTKDSHIKWLIVQDYYQ